MDPRGNPIASVDQAGKSWNYTYKSQGLPLTLTSPGGGVFKWTYAADGTTASVTTSTDNPTTHERDNLGRVYQDHPLKTPAVDTLLRSIGLPLFQMLLFGYAVEKRVRDALVAIEHLAGERYSGAPVDSFTRGSASLILSITPAVAPAFASSVTFGVTYVCLGALQLPEDCDRSRRARQTP